MTENKKTIARVLCLHMMAAVRRKKIGCFSVNITLKQYNSTIANLKKNQLWRSLKVKCLDISNFANTKVAEFTKYRLYGL